MPTKREWQISAVRAGLARPHITVAQQEDGRFKATCAQHDSENIEYVGETETEALEQCSHEVYRKLHLGIL